MFDISFVREKHSKFIHIFISFLLTSILSGVAFAQSPAPKPIIEWQKRQTSNERLTAFGDDLMGDAIDTHIGSLVFTHTDVSIPGNSGLDVSVRRRLNQGYKYDEGVNVEFGDWELMAPKISVTASAQFGWAGNRCSGTWAENFPTVYAGLNGTTLFAKDYTNGVTMTIPGQGDQQVLKNPSSQFPAAAEASTVGEWYFTCTTASDGKQGFIGHAPNGDKYEFKKFMTRQAKETGFNTRTNNPVARVKVILAATKATDVHGNYVNYTYDSANRLTRIESNDEGAGYGTRRIDLAYSGNLITSVTANGRTWNYGYRQSTWDKPDWDVNNYGPLNSKVLSTVTQPDGQYWSFNLDAMQAESQPPTARPINHRGYTVSLKHPYGTVGTFSLKDIRHRQAYKYLQTVPEGNPIALYDREPEAPCANGAPCANSSGQQPIQIMSIRTMAAMSKKLSSPSIQDMTWTFDYEQDMSCAALPFAYDCATAPAPPPPSGTGTGGTLPGGGSPVPPGEPTCTGPNCVGNYFWEPFDNFGLNWDESSLRTSLRSSQKPKPNYVKFASANRNLLPDELDLAPVKKSMSDAPILDETGMFAPKVDPKPVLMAQVSGGFSLSQRSPSDTYWLTNSPTYHSDVMYSSSGHDPLDFTNWTKVTQPNGSVITYYHLWTWEQSFGGKLIKQTTSFGGTVMDEINYTYAQHTCNGGMTIFNGAASTSSSCPTQTTSTVQKRDGDTYTSKSAFNMNPSASNYSFGKPVQTQSYSNMTLTLQADRQKRITDTSYSHNTSKWILGLPLSVTTNGRNMATYTYNANGQKTQETQYGALRAKYDYNPDGTVNWFEDALQRRTTAFRWKRGTPQRVRLADNTTNYHQYVDDNGWLDYSYTARGHMTDYTRDSMGRLTTYDPPIQSSTTVSYSFGATPTQTITRGSKVETITYDTMFRPTEVNVGGQIYTTIEYNSAGQKYRESLPSSSPTPSEFTTYGYDGLGRTKTVTTSAGTTTASYYSHHQVHVRDPENNNVITYMTGLDGPGKGTPRYIYEYAPERRITRMEHNVWGELEWVGQYGDNGENKVQYYDYDAQRRICRYATSEGGHKVFRYDAAGYLKDFSQEAGLGSGCGNMTAANRATLYYNALGQNYYTDYWSNSTMDVVKTFDENGNIKKMKRGLGSGATGANRSEWTYYYNEVDQLTHEYLDMDGRDYDLYYGYNNDGDLIKRILPSGRHINYTVDTLGRHNSVKNGISNIATNISYHPNGVASGFTYGNGHTYIKTLNALQQPEHVVSYKGSTVAFDRWYAYNPRGLITSIADVTNSAYNQTFTYDGIGQLKTATNQIYGNGVFEYDALGNITRKDMLRRRVLMTYDTNTNRLASYTDNAGPSKSLTYDYRGNVTQFGNQSFTYDLTNRPVTAFGDSIGTYVYDGNLKRVKHNVGGETIYNIYDKSGSLVHIDNLTKGEKTDYVKALEMTLARIKTVGSTDTTSYLHNDHVGSASVATDSLGAIKWSQMYTPFGEEWVNSSATNDHEGYAGHIKDKATGLTYMQARYYDPVIGRFLSVDPVAFTPSVTGMFNRYSYVLNDPINDFDPTGMTCFSVCPHVGQFAKGAYKTLRGYGAWIRYGNGADARTGRPESFDFVNKAFAAGFAIASEEPATAAFAGRVLLDRKADKGLAYNLGGVAAGGGVSSLVKTGGKTAFKKGVQHGFKTGANSTIGMSGAAIDSAYQAFDKLTAGGVDTKNISSEAMTKIGLAAIAEASFSYNSEKNILTATMVKETTGSRITKFRVNIKLDEEK